MANERFTDKIKTAIGLSTDFDEDYEDDEYEEEDYGYDVQSEEIVNEPVYNSQRNDPGSADVLVLDPESFEEAPSIVQKLKMSKTIVVNLKQVEYEEGRRIYDFLSGAVYALEGSLNHIAESVFILAPKEVSVSTKMDKNHQKSGYSAEYAEWND